MKYTSVISPIITVIYGLSVYLDTKNRNGSSNFFYVLRICQSFVIYWLGHIGIYRFGLREEKVTLQKVATCQKVAVSFSGKNEHIIAFEKYIVEDKNFLDSNLTLDLVSEKLGLSKSYLSRMINAELNTSYTDFINSLRVQKEKYNIQKAESEKYILITIGLEAGFNSKFAFNKAFKKYTGFTPSEFKKSLNRPPRKL